MRTIPRLTITAEFDGVSREGVFEFGPAEEGTWSVEQVHQTQSAVSSGQQIAQLLSRVSDDIEAPSGGVEVALSVQQVWEVSAATPVDTTHDDGTPYRWGSTVDRQKSSHSATGAKAMAQMDVFQAYLSRTVGDSVSPVSFEFGEFSSSGVYSPVSCLVEEPRTSIKDGATTASVELTVVRVADLTDPGSVLEAPE